MDSNYAIAFVVINLLITFLFLKRLNKKGCITFGYIGLIILSINSLAIVSWMFFYGSVNDVYNISTSGKSYEATVVNYITEKRYDSDKRQHYYMHQPIVSFTAKNGEIITKELDFSSSDIEIGNTYRVNYNEENDTIITLGFILILKLTASFIFCLILTFLSAGIIKYILKHSMEGFYSLLSTVGFYFLIPFLMLGFTALLIYGIFYGNEVPWFITALLTFFALIMCLSTVGYLKMIFTKGKPKMKKVAPGRWTGDWKD